MRTLDQLLIELSQREVNLWIEDDRLRYRAAKDSLTPELLAEVKSRKLEIVKFLKQATENRISQIPPIEPISRSGSLPLSFAQQRFWYLHQFEPDSSSNNMPVVVRFVGSLNVSVLEKSIHELVRRHEVLRTHFPSVNGQPTQVISQEASLPFPVIDLRQFPEAQREAEAFKLATKEARRPFKLEHESVLRLLLLHLQDDEHMLIWNMHCMICDGASSDVFYRDLTAIYTAFVAGKPSPLPDLPVQYVDFAYWQRQWLQGEVLESQLNYWKQKLEGNLPIIKLPTDHSRPPIVQTYRGDRCARMLPKSLNASLHKLSQQLGATQFMTLIAAFEILLHRYSQQNDILISFASAGRGQVETEGLVGFFSNTLIQRINFDGNPTFRELLGRVREASLEAYSNQDLPFEKLVEELPSGLTHSRSPLFQVKFALNPPWSNGRGMASVKLPDLTITSLFGYIYHGKTKYDLIVVMREQDEGLGMVFDYNADLFDASTITRMLGHLENLLEGIVANPDQKVSELPLLSNAEQQKILYGWNANHIPIQEICIHQLFESQVELFPNAIAVINKNEHLTYRELNNRANQLAHYLQVQGVGTETLVAICIEKSTEMLVGMLGILKSGGTYIPLDTACPHERQISELRNAKASVILTQSNLLPNPLEYDAKMISLDTDWEAISKHSNDNPSSSVTLDNLAYVIYNSSSIGEPVGVTITHGGLANHILAVNKVYQLISRDRVLQFSSISSGSAVEEIFSTLLSGSTVVLPSSEIHSSIAYFLEDIAHQEITVINLPTDFWKELVNHMSMLQQLLPQNIRLVIVGGEKVAKSTYQKWKSLVEYSPRWLNTYGCTEVSVTATIYDPLSFAQELPSDAEIPIGRAIANLQTYVLDQNLQLSPVGVAGELYIGGIGLSRGYLNRPDLTAIKFIPNPFSENLEERLYKTGDIVRYLPDGNIDFINRSDFQIKLRGFRIEPLEIETKLEQYFAINQAIVLCQESPEGNKSLVAYLSIKQDRILNVESLKCFLQEDLPVYMIPTNFFILDSLPLTPNGKVDRLALIDINRGKQQYKEVISPRDELEQELATIWQKLLGGDTVSIHAKFFDLGGNSLLSVRLVTEIEKNFNYHFPLSSFFQIGTIAEIAKWMREKASERISPNEIPTGLSFEDYRAFLLLCSGRVGKHIGQRGLIVEVTPTEMKSSKPFIWIGYIDFSKNLGLHQPVYTIPGGSWTPFHSTEKYIEAIASIIVDELLSVLQEEPYLIGGNCYEGLVALEVAHQLKNKGKDVAFLAIIDKPGPSKIYDKCHQLDIKICILRYHLSELFPLSLIDKIKYITDRLFSFNSKRKIKKMMDDPEPSKPTNEYDRILPETWDSIDQASNSYHHKSYSGRVILTSPTKSGLRSGEKDILWTDLSWLFPYYGWGSLLTGRVELHKIKCAHSDVGMKQYAEEIGHFIWDACDKFR